MLGEATSVTLQFKRELLRAHITDPVTYPFDDEMSEPTGFLARREGPGGSIAGTGDINDSGGGTLLTMEDRTEIFPG